PVPPPAVAPRESAGCAAADHRAAHVGYALHRAAPATPLWTSALMDHDLRHRIEDADDKASGEDRGGDAVLLEDLLHQLVAQIEHLEDDCDEHDRYDAPQDRAAEGLKETNDVF